MELRDLPAMRIDRLEIRPAERAALVDGRHLALTGRELAVLAVLASAGDRVLTREELHETVWGSPLRDGDRSIDVYVSRLRRKLAAALPGVELIHTHFGIGYRFGPRPLTADSGPDLRRSHLFNASATAG